MRREVQITIAAIVVSATSSALAAGPRSQSPPLGPLAFVGLWEGIDPFDGSTQRLSITCSDQTFCDIRLTDTVFTDCGGGTGFARGEGVIEDGAMSVPEFLLTCQNGLVLEASEMFVPDFANGTLINLDARSSSSPSTVFHKISR